MLGTGDVEPLTIVVCIEVEGLVLDLVSKPASSLAGMSGLWSGLSRVVKYPDGKSLLEATLCDDLYEANPMHL